MALIYYLGFFYFFFIAFLVAITTSSEVKQNPMLVFPLKSTKSSLDTEHFLFVLLPQDNQNENRTLILEVTFPTRSFTELDPSSIYTFVPEILCLSCLKYMSAMKGNFYKGIVNVGESGSEAVKLLTAFWVSIESILKDDEITDLSNIHYYFFLTSFTGEAREVLIMKRLDQFNKPKPIFQILRADLFILSSLSEETPIISQFTQFPINGKIPMIDGEEYDSIVLTVKQTLTNVKFRNIKNLVCLYSKDYSSICEHTKLKIDNDFFER